jgi:succinoglycan biosynthesis transport protein ExoP
MSDRILGSGEPSEVVVAPALSVPVHPDALQWNRRVVDDVLAPSIWQMMRRDAFLIGLCALLAGVVGLLVTSRLPRLYESSVSVRVDPKSGQLAAIGVSSISSENAVATELEMLRSRALAQDVVDSTGFRLRLAGATSALHPGLSRSSVISDVHVAHDAPDAEYRLVAPQEGDGLEVWSVKDEELLIPAVAAGTQVRVRGVTFRLTEQARSEAPLNLVVLPADDAVDSVQTWMSASRRSRDADLLDVRVRGGDPTLVRDVASAYGHLYIAGHQDARQLEAKRAADFLHDQIERMSKQLSGAERALRDYRSRAGVVSLRDEATTGVSHRAELLAQRNAINAEREALAQLLRSSRDRRAEPGSAPFRELLAFPTLLRSDAAIGIQSALTAAEQRRSELLTHRTERDADVKALDTRIAELNQQLSGFVSTYLQGLTNQVQALDKDLSSSDTALSTLPEKELREAELERTAKNTETVFAMLQERYKEAEIAAAATDASIRLVDSAVMPRRPVSPKPLVNLVLALVVGVAVGIAGAFVRESGDRSLRTRSQLLALTGSPVLSLIPRLHALPALTSRLPGFGRRRVAIVASDSADGVRGSRALVRSREGGSRATYAENSLFGFAESYARLVTNLGFAGHSQPIRVLLVTSPLPGDGKTTVATNLALTLAREGKRVLLVDADLRGGRIAAMLGLSATSGLSETLARQVDFSNALSRVAIGGNELHVLARGKGLGDPASLLATDAPRDLIDRARGLYDMVIVDTPPVNSVADAPLLTRHCDGVLLVARAGVTARDALVFAMEQLRIVRAPVVGAVLNDVDLRRDAGVDGAYEYYGQYPSGSAA